MRPAFGDTLASWRVTPVAARLALRPGSGSDATRAVLQLLPILLQLLGLAAVVWRGARLGNGIVAVVLHFAGFWAMLFATTHIVSLAIHPAAPLAYLLGPMGGNRGARITLAVLLLIGVVTAGAICARRLLAYLRGMQPDSKRSWTDLAWLVLVTCSMLALIAGTRLGWLQRSGSPWLFVPPGLVLVVAMLGWVRRGPAALPPPLGARGRGVLIVLAALSCGGLALVPVLRGWADARVFAHVQTAHFDVAYTESRFSRADVEAFGRQLEVDRDSILARAGGGEAPALRVFLHDDLDAMRVATQQGERTWISGTEIHTTLEGTRPVLDVVLLAQALVSQAWGTPSGALPAAWVASWLAGGWRGESLESWVAQVGFEEGAYALATLLAPESDPDLSPLVRTPLGAAWLETVASTHGRAALRSLYATGERGLPAAAGALGTTPAALESAWRAWCDTLAVRTDVTELERWRPDPTVFLRGMTLSYEGYRGGGGYDSRAARDALASLRDQGVNAIALVPYGFQRGIDDTRISYTSSDESDTELAAGLRAAHALGLRVMLKPQLWVRHGQFTGEIAFSDAAKRGSWMQSYRRFALHYARLAELEGFDLLCIGTELGGLTQHTAEWRALIRAVREVYHGPITYAAHWDREITSIAFWDALDYIGVNAYAPLLHAGEALADTMAMRSHAAASGAALEALAKRWRRPVLFTEIGYASVPNCLVEPWSESGPVDVAAQATAYRVALTTYARAPWLRGMFWWKWHSNGAGGGGLDPSFTPMGKPAGDTLRTWFTRMATQAAFSSAIALADTVPRLRPDTTATAPRDTVVVMPFTPEVDTTSTIDFPADVPLDSMATVPTDSIAPTP